MLTQVREQGVHAHTVNSRRSLITLAVRLTVPPAGSVEDLHLQAGAPGRAHHYKKKQDFLRSPAVLSMFIKELSDKLAAPARQSQTAQTGAQEQYGSRQRRRYDVTFGSDIDPSKEDIIVKTGVLGKYRKRSIALFQE